MANPPGASRKRDVIVQTSAPRSPVESPKKKIPADLRDQLGYDLWQQIQQGVSDMELHKINLDYNNDLYEMRVPDSAGNDPWPDASAVFLPLIPKIMDTIAARLASLVFQPRLFLVNGNTPDAAAVQAQVERFYNAESARYNWTDIFFNWLMLALRDGVGILEILWKKKLVSRKKIFYEPQIDPDTQQPMIDPNTMKPIITKTVRMATDIEWDAVSLEPVPFRYFRVYPIWVRTIQDPGCLMVARARFYTEEEIQGMVNSGDLWEDKAEEAMSYIQEGQDERNIDMEGTATITANDQMNISEGTVNVAPYRRQRGPFKIWVCFSKQYDMDDDGTPEFNVFWVDELSQRCLGYQPFQYWHGQYPYVELVPMPRPEILPGFGVPERLASIQAELNTRVNQTNNATDRAITPPIVIKEGARAADSENRIGPNAMWETENPKEDVVVLEMPDVPLSSWQELQYHEQQAEAFMGVDSVMQGVATAGRRSAQEISARQQSAGIRLDLVANRLRFAIKAAFWQIHQLNLQYGPDQMQTNVNQSGVPQKLQLDKQTLAQDFDLDVVGSGGPLDRSTRQQDMMLLYTLLMKNPLVVNNLERVWAVTQMLLENWDRPDLDILIGTREDAQQTQQAMQQQQAMEGAARSAQEQAQQSQQGQNGAGPQGGPGAPTSGGEGPPPGP